MPDLISAEHAGEYRIRVAFDDGRGGVVDLRPIIESGGVFERIRDLADFARFEVNRELGIIAWGDEIDIAPETLYHLATGDPLPGWMDAAAEAVREHDAPYGPETDPQGGSA